MTLYCKWFNSHSEYETYKNGLNYILPNVSICYRDLDVHYEKQVRDYSNEYLTFEALGDIAFSVVYEGEKDYITQEMRESFSYSIDDGETWVTFTTPNDTYSGTALTTPTIHSGERVLWKGIGNCNDSQGGAHCHFTASGKADFNVSGNIMSLVSGDNFIGQSDLRRTYALFKYLFEDNSNLVNAENLILPATTLADSCYHTMFYGCTSLTTAPELPATTLADSCYHSMFDGCTSLTTAPELPATSLADSCYYNMFFNCMNLTTAPELPATSLADSCYNYMFSWCASLTTAPELPATTLADGCYQYMFQNCTNLNYIKAMFTTTPSSTYTADWVLGVAPTGTFVKNSAATWGVTGAYGVPSGWRVQTASA